MAAGSGLLATSSFGRGFPVSQENPSASAKWTRVKTVIELKGEVHIPDPKSVVPGAFKTAPVESASTLEYEENYLVSTEPLQGLVSYQNIVEGTVENRINKQAIDLKLRPECSNVVRYLEGERLVTNCVDHSLRLNERDLIEGPMASMFVDQLLPGKSVRLGDAWTPEREVLRQIFQLDSISDTSLKVKLVEATQEKGQLELQGDIHGETHQVKTKLTIQGKAQVDRTLGLITWVALSIDEDREIGKGEPGFKIAARIRMLRSDLEEPTAKESLATLASRAADIDSAKWLEYRLERGGFLFTADENWRVISDSFEQSVMRFVKKDKAIAQCNLKHLPSMEAGHQLTLEAFQMEVRESLGEGFVEFLDSSERKTRSGLRLLQVTSSGSVQGVTVQWINCHFSDDTGKRASISFALDASLQDAFGGAEQPIIDGVELIERGVMTKPSDVKVSGKAETNAKR